MPELEEQDKRRERRNLILRTLAHGAETLVKYLREQARLGNTEDGADLPLLEDLIVWEAVDKFYELLNHASYESEMIVDLHKNISPIDDGRAPRQKIKYSATVEEIKKQAIDIDKLRKKAERSRHWR